MTTHTAEVSSIIAEARAVAKERGFNSDAGAILVLAQTVAYLARGASPGFLRHAASVSEVEFGSGKGRVAL